jgi:hypothetical protein
MTFFEFCFLTFSADLFTVGARTAFALDTPGFLLAAGFVVWSMALAADTVFFLAAGFETALEG